MLLKFWLYFPSDKFFKCTTWSTISPAERFLSNFSFPVAQNLQAKLQPTCEEIQAVILVLVGIKTPSTTFPTPTLKAHFIVRSLEICCSSKVMSSMNNCSFNCSRNFTLKLVISSNEAAFFCHNHS